MKKNYLKLLTSLLLSGTLCFGTAVQSFAFREALRQGISDLKSSVAGTTAGTLEDIAAETTAETLEDTAAEATAETLEGTAAETTAETLEDTAAETTAEMFEDAADKPVEESLNDFLVNQSINMTCTMGELSQSDEYFELSFPMDPDTEEVLNSLRGEDYASPEKAVIITVPDEMLDLVIQMAFAGTLDSFEDGRAKIPDLSEDAYRVWADKAFVLLPLEVNDKSYISAYLSRSLVASVLSVNKSFRRPEDFSGYVCVVLLYKNNVSATMFCPSGDGAVSASSGFLFLKDEQKNALANGTGLRHIINKMQEESAAGYDVPGLEDVKVEYIEIK